MPGIPRKTYCQNCKRRRVKCDEKWPNCSACVRARVECPGPSSRTKFVHHNNYKASGDKEEAGSSPSHSQDLSPTTSSGPILADRPFMPAVKANGHGAEFRFFRLRSNTPRVLTNPCDRLSSRLVKLMEAPGQEIIARFRPLKAIPNRLARSKCLQDAIAYCCSCWTDYNLGRREPSFDSLKHYGKALRSLQRAIQGPDAFTVETITAATVMYHVRDVFNTKTPRAIRIEWQGIATLTNAKGLPNMDDPLDVLVAFENLYLTTSLSLLFEGEGKYDITPARREALERVIDQVFLSENAPEVDIAVYKYGIFDRPDHMRTMRRCHKDPIPFYREARRLEMDLNVLTATLDTLASNLWSDLEAQGKITEVADPSFFLGSRFNIDSLKTLKIIEESVATVPLIYMQIVSIRRLYNQPPDMSVETRYRNLSVRLWKCIPYLRTIEPLEALGWAFSMPYTFDAASEQEKDHLYDFILDVDVLHGAGKTREGVANYLLPRIKYQVGVIDIDQLRLG